MGGIQRRAACALAAAAALAGCGGGGITTVGGTVSGLPQGTAVTLQLDGGEIIVVAGNGSFRFSDDVSAGSRYSVTILSQPARAECVLSNNTGRVDDNASRVDNVKVTCSARHELRGSLTGLGADDTVSLQNNEGDTLTLRANGAFAFATLLAEGATYSVAVSRQPASGATCTVAQGTGTVKTADVTDVLVTCN